LSREREAPIKTCATRRKRWLRRFDNFFSTREEVIHTEGKRLAVGGSFSELKGGREEKRKDLAEENEGRERRSFERPRGKKDTTRGSRCSERTGSVKIG